MNDYLFRYDWFTNNIPTWKEHLVCYAGAEDITFVEIGCWEGRSAVWLLENILLKPSCRLHCIDPWASPNGEVIEDRFNYNTRLVSNITSAQLIKHKDRSIDILPSFSGESVDVVYVDGSHIAKDVLSDILLSWRIIKQSGILICDDYELDQEIQFHDGYETYSVAPPLHRPRMAIDAFLQCFDGHYRLLHKGWQVLLRKCDLSVPDSRHG
jgi:hypothetical protein